VQLLAHLPPRPFLGSILLRTAVAWAFVRFAVAFAMALSDVQSTGSVILAIPVVLFALLAVLGDMARRNEITFLRNLGVGRRDLILLALPVLVTLEVGLALVLALRR